MKEELVTFEIAKLAKEKGYKGNPPYFGYVDKFYEKNGTVRSYGMHRVKNINELAYAPTQSLLQKWLREIHKLHLTVYYHKSNKYYVSIHNDCDINMHTNLFGEMFNTYEEALEEGLLKALKLIDEPVKKSEVLKQEVITEGNDLKILGKYTKVLREERFEKFGDYREALLRKGCDIVEHESQGKFTIDNTSFGIIDYYPKANKVLIRKDNDWKKPGLKWIITNLLNC